MVLDTLLQEERQENLLMISIMKAKDKEIATLKLQVEPVRAENFMLKTNLGSCQENLIDCGAKAAKNKPWAALGKIYTGAICVGVLVGGTVVVLNALK